MPKIRRRNLPHALMAHLLDRIRRFPTDYTGSTTTSDGAMLRKSVALRVMIP